MDSKAPIVNQALMVSKVLMRSKAHTGSSLKVDSLGHHTVVQQVVMEDVMKVKTACIMHGGFSKQCFLIERPEL